jgi:hypothetical protein
MATESILKNQLTTLPFETFWAWIAEHANCILRAGTPEAILFDDDDYHWTFVQADAKAVLAQVIRGKRLVGELYIVPADITYVQVQPGENEEYVFELVAESDANDRYVPYYFVLSHPYDDIEIPDGAGGGGEPWVN